MMKNQQVFLALLFAFIGDKIFYQNISVAQIIPDSLFSEKSIVNKSGNKQSITGGAARGKNLFHSFQKFNVDRNEVVQFDSNGTIVNIFSKVVGGSPSYIFGEITALKNENIFLLNPSGILFGPGARLNLTGSFFATTSTKFRLNSPLLNFDFLNRNLIPQKFVDFTSIDLIFEGSSKPIFVQNIGHSITEPSALLPHTQNSIPGLTIPASSIALIGDGIYLNGGIVSTPSGKLSVISVDKGKVNLSNRAKYQFKVDGDLADIKLTQSSLLDASGGGSVQVQGRNINIFDGSTILVENLFTTSNGSISIAASKDLTISGESPLTFFRSSISGENLGIGNAPSIDVKSQNINLLNGGIIGIRNFGFGNGGLIQVEATNDLNILDSFLRIPTQFSSIASITASPSPSADINVTTRRLKMENGGNIGTSTFGVGSSGNVNIFAKKSIDISGFTSSFFAPSTITAATFSQGDAGTITVNTRMLNLFRGGTIGTSTLGQGNSGQIDIVALEQVSLTGLDESAFPNQIAPLQTTIDSSAELFPALQQIFDLPSILTGNASGIRITTPSLTLRNGAAISVLNEGTGSAGDVVIDSSITSLFDSNILASTISGTGGDIQISANLLNVIGNSSIIADSVRGSGGAININVDGLNNSLNAQISAKSGAGRQLDGIVNIQESQSQIELTDNETPNVESPVKIAINCAAGNSSIVNSASGVVGSSGISDRDLLDIPSLKLRMAIADQYTYVNSDGETVPFKRWLGIQQTSDGSLEFVWDPKQSDTLHNLISSDGRNCTYKS